MALESVVGKSTSWKCSTLEEIGISSSFYHQPENKHGGSEPFRSAPAQKARPSPVTIPIRREGSISSHFHTRSSSALPAELMQLRSLDRHKVTSRTWGAGKEILVNDVEGGEMASIGVRGDIFLATKVVELILREAFDNGR